MGKMMNDTWRDLLISSLTNEDKSDLAYERQQALLEQKNNRDQLRKNLSSYRAKIGAQGISPSSGSALSVQKGMIEKTQDDNQKIAQSFNQKIKKNATDKKKKTLLALARSLGVTS